MASQNTVSRDKLTNQDKKVFSICRDMVGIILNNIPDGAAKVQFKKEYGILHESRDAGQGRAAGKLQRDALTTRGRQAKAPFSNRNLRWHPLVIANNCSENFSQIDSVSIGAGNILLFKIGGKEYPPEEVYKLDRAYCITAEKWLPISDELRKWGADDWIKNWCTIPAVEYCTPRDAIESFAILGLTVACSFFKANLENAHDDLKQYILSIFPKEISLPDCSNDLIVCPLCLSPINSYPCELKARQRPEIWKPSWQKSKRDEGEDESLQLTHVEPLQEGKICHTAKLTRYGHRWCNVAMTDHSVDVAVNFMRAICEKHDKLK